jgi:hypothetical protein
LVFVIFLKSTPVISYTRCSQPKDDSTYLSLSKRQLVAIFQLAISLILLLNSVISQVHRPIINA